MVSDFFLDGLGTAFTEKNPIRSSKVKLDEQRTRQLEFMGVRPLPP
jgi:hypothetical protein